jgi:hypothetical protein
METAMMAFPPLDPSMMEAVLNTFGIVAKAATGLIGALFIVRSALLLVSMESAESYFMLFKETLTLLLALTIFPHAFRILVSGTGELAGLIRVESQMRELGAIDEFFSAISQAIPWISFLNELGSLAVYHVIRAVYSVLIGLLAVASPLVFISAYLTGRGIGVSQVSTMILAMCLWPTLWNVIGLLGSKLWLQFQGSSLSSLIFSIVVLVLQIFSPLFCLSLLRDLRPQAAISAAARIGTATMGGITK